MLAQGKLRAPKRVMIPKLLEPPLRARQRFSSEDLETVITDPDASTTS